jgi:hypothetical protein
MTEILFLARAVQYLAKYITTSFTVLSNGGIKTNESAWNP